MNGIKRCLRFRQFCTCKSCAWPCEWTFRRIKHGHGQVLYILPTGHDSLLFFLGRFDPDTKKSLERWTWAAPYYYWGSPANPTGVCECCCCLLLLLGLLHVHLPSKSNVLYIISSLRLFLKMTLRWDVGELVISSNYVNVWATSSATNQIWYTKFSQSGGYIGAVGGLTSGGIFIFCKIMVPVPLVGQNRTHLPYIAFHCLFQYVVACAWGDQNLGEMYTSSNYGCHKMHPLLIVSIFMFTYLSYYFCLLSFLSDLLFISSNI